MKGKLGLRKHAGESKDAHDCAFPYECYTEHGIDTRGEYIERLYVCPWWPEEKFSTLKALKAWISAK